MPCVQLGRRAPGCARHRPHGALPAPAAGPVPACSAGGCRRHRRCRWPRPARCAGLPPQRAAAPRAPAPSHFQPAPRVAGHSRPAAPAAAACARRTAPASRHAGCAGVRGMPLRRRCWIHPGTTARRAGHRRPTARSCRCTASTVPWRRATVPAAAPVRRAPAGTASGHPARCAYRHPGRWRARSRALQGHPHRRCPAH